MHLDRGIRDDLSWQVWWCDLVVMPSRSYDAPSGLVGHRFVGTLGVELKWVRDRLWNSERFIVFQTAILQRSRHVTASQAIRRRIGKRLDAWAEGKHSMLVEDTLQACGEYLTIARREETAEHWAQTYHSLVLCRKLRTSVRLITERETGRVLQPRDQCTKTGYWVMEVLRAKQPEAQTPTAASMDSYPDRTPEITPVDITKDTVTTVAGRLSVGAGPGGIDLVYLQHCLLRFQAASG